MRVPAFRPTLLRIADGIHRQFFAKALKTPRSWAACLKKMGIAPDAPGADYEKMLEFERGHNYELFAEPEWFLYRGFKALGGVVSSLGDRYWRAAVSSSGSFIGSDNPVSMDGPENEFIGFKSADIVAFAVSRHVLVFGTKYRVRPADTTRKRIAAQNTLTMLCADEQVYSHVPDFCWLDESGTYQTDWKLFSKEKFLKHGIGGLQPPTKE